MAVDDKDGRRHRGSWIAGCVNAPGPGVPAAALSPSTIDKYFDLVRKVGVAVERVGEQHLKPPIFGYNKAESTRRLSARAIEQPDVDHTIRHCSNGAS